MREVFADTNYWVAIAVPTDQWHAAAKSAKVAIGTAILVTTDEVICEYLNILGNGGTALRERAVRSARAILNSPNVTVLPQTRAGLLRGLDLYESRRDKQYSVTDCISMNVMEHRGIREVLTSDHHFAQEGFTLLMQK